MNDDGGYVKRMQSKKQNSAKEDQFKGGDQIEGNTTMPYEQQNFRCQGEYSFIRFVSN